MYFLKGKNNDGDNMYFTLDSVGAPTYTYDKPDAFKAPHDEIVPWKTPFWEIEPVGHSSRMRNVDYMRTSMHTSRFQNVS